MMETLSTNITAKSLLNDPEKNSGSSWDLNPGPSDYYSDTLTTEPLDLLWQRSVGLMLIS